MLNNLEKLLANISALVFPPEVDVSRQQTIDYYALVDQARRDWHDAKHRFNQISDPDLVDHAIYAMDASERRFMYLLKKAREEGVNMSSYHNS